MGQLAVCWILYGVGYCEYHQDDCEIMTEYIVVLSDYREEDWGEHTLVPTHTFGPFNTEDDAWEWTIKKLPQLGIIHTMSEIVEISSP
jgi:hypothetical protein